MLVEVNTCPVCGSHDRTHIAKLCDNKLSGVNYLKHVASQLNISVNELIDKINVYQCNNCSNYYHNPWLSKSLASDLFNVQSPDHIAGWNNFEHWIGSDTYNSDEFRNHEIYEWLKVRIGTFNTYAEFGCPFQGFLMYFRGLELNPSQRVALFKRVLLKSFDVRWNKVTRLYYFIVQMAQWIVVGYFKLKLLSQSRDKRLGKNSNVKLPVTRYFLTEDTARGWNANCVRYDKSCKYFASSMLHASVLPLTEVVENKTIQLDLIGIFNFLDHTSNPLRVIKDCLSLSNNLLIITHRAKYAGKQHLYAFSDEFSKWLGTTLEKVNIQDLTNEPLLAKLQKDYSYLLITRV